MNLVVVIGLVSKLTPNPGMQATVTSGLRPPVPGPDADR